MNTSFDSSGSHQGIRYKTVMNILRRAFSFRRRERDSNHEDEKSSNSVNISNSSATHSATHSQQSSPSPISSDIASTSRDSLSFADILSVYEDPFVAVTSDGSIYIKFYYEFNPRIEFRIEDIHLAHVRRSCRVIRINRIKDMHFATYYDLTNTETCKSWGITRNDVWWASHANRMNSVNQYASVCINDEMSIKAGFSVVHLEAFIRTLKLLGLSTECSFNQGIPSPPISRCQIPFIDEEDEDKDK